MCTYINVERMININLPKWFEDLEQIQHFNYYIDNIPVYN